MSVFNTPRPFRLLATTALTATLFVACADDEATETASTDPEDVVAAEISIDPETAGDLPSAALADTLGTFEGEVSALTIWQHPTASFQSAVLAANGTAGLFLIPIDGTTPSFTEGSFTGGLDLTYTPAGNLVAAYDGALEAIQLFTISPADRAIAPVTSVAVEGGAKALCFVGTALFRINDEGDIFRHDIAVGDDGLAVSETAITGGVSALACDGTDTELYVLRQRGLLSKLVVSEDDTSAEALANPAPGATSIAAVMTEGGDPALLFGLGDGSMQLEERPFTLRGFAAETDTVEIAHIAAAGGNVGGVYRGGLVSVLGEDGSLGLLPWFGVTNAVGLDIPTVSLQGETAGVSTELFSTRREITGDVTNTPVPPALDLPTAPPDAEPAE